VSGNALASPSAVVIDRASSRIHAGRGAFARGASEDSRASIKGSLRGALAARFDAS
jgi:hypothetical protein